MYDMLVNNFNIFPNKVNWVKLLHGLLGELGFMEAWIQQNVRNKRVFLSLVKQRLQDIFIQNTNARLNDSFRARFYRNFDNFEYKTYLDSVTIKIYLVQKETQCFYLQFSGLKIIDFKSCFNSVVLPSNQDLDCRVSS